MMHGDIAARSRRIIRVRSTDATRRFVPIEFLCTLSGKFLEWQRSPMIFDELENLRASATCSPCESNTSQRLRLQSCLMRLAQTAQFSAERP